MRRHLGLVILTGALSGAPVWLAAQEAAAPQAPLVTPSLAADPFAVPPGVSSVAFRTLDQDRLLRESLLGQRIMAGIETERQALETENQQIVDQLAEEERALTEARTALSPEEFRARADAFDARVEEIRAEREQRNQAFQRHSQEEAQRFFDAAGPVVQQLMQEEGILALLAPETMIVHSDWLDLTDAVIARLDALTAAGADGAGESPAAPQTTAP